MDYEMRDILAFGSIVIDNVIIVEKFASENETVQAKSYRYSFGGAGANVAVAASRLGTLSGIFAVSGYDFKRMGYRNYLLNQGVDISGAISNDGFPMPRSFIFTKDRTGNQILYYYENKRKTARLLFENEHLASKFSRNYKILHFSTGHFEFYYDLLRKSKLSGERIISFDPGQEIFTYPYRVRRLLKFCHLLFMNKYEAKRLKEVLRVKSIKEIKGPKLICVSFGSVGCVVMYKSRTFKIPAVKPDKLVDPTGAGDAHRAGFLSGLIRGYDILISGRIASTVASFAIEAQGAQTSLPSWKDVEKRYERAFKGKLGSPDGKFGHFEEEMLSKHG